jgi:hypothetical protein
MGKIISQTLEVEAVHEPTQEHEEVSYFEVLDNEITSRPGLTRMGYDDEIGLWEELLHRGNHSKLDTA